MNENSKFSELVEDYSRHPVPAGKVVSGLRIAMILVGITITVPAFLIGIHVGQQQGFAGTAIASILGGLILFVIGACTGVIAVRTRLSTYMIIPLAFGRLGAHVVNALIGLTLLGWYGVIGSLFASSLQSSLTDVLGFSLHWLAYLLLGSALMVLFMFYILYLVLDSEGLDAVRAAGGQGVGIDLGVSAIVGGYIIGMTLFPDICRYAESERGAIIGAFLGCVVGYPIVLMIAGVAGIAEQAVDFIALIIALGLGIGGVSFLVFSTWTTNANTLYSTSLALATVAPRVPKWQLALVAGVAGTLMASAGIIQRFEQFLVILSILIPPVAGIYITDYFLVNRRRYHQSRDRAVEFINVRAFVAWIVASGISFLTGQNFFQLTTISSLDAILIACVIYLILQIVPQNNFE